MKRRLILAAIVIAAWLAFMAYQRQQIDALTGLVVPFVS